MTSEIIVRDTDALTKKYVTELGDMIVNGKKLADHEKIALARFSAVNGMNPTIGEAYYLPGTGPVPGIAWIRTKAQEQLEYEGEKTRMPQAKFWTTAEQYEDNLDPGDIGVKVTLYDTISRSDWEQRKMSMYIQMMKNGIPNEIAWDRAGELVGPEPCWTGIGVVYNQEKFAGDGKPEKMSRQERAEKRAEKQALKKRFPRMRIPEPNPMDDVGVIDSTYYEEYAAIPENVNETIASLGYDVPEEEPQQDYPEPGKVERPYWPELLKHKMGEISSDYLLKGVTVPDVSRKVLASVMDPIFDGKKDMRYDLTEFLYGVRSTSDLGDHQVKAMLKWLGVESFGDVPSKDAIQEAKTAWEYFAKQNGQLDLGLSDN